MPSPKRPAAPPKTPVEPALDARLAATLKLVGPEHYAQATAHEFAPGGRFNPKRKKPRYAIT